MLVSTLIVSGAFLIAPSATGVPVCVAEPVPAHAQAANDAVSGTVGAVDWENKVFLISTDAEESRSVSWTGDTAFVLDGEKSTAREVLSRDAKVSVEFGEEDGVAARIERASE